MRFHTLYDVRKVVTLNDIEPRIGCYFALFQTKR